MSTGPRIDPLTGEILEDAEAESPSWPEMTVTAAPSSVPVPASAPTPASNVVEYTVSDISAAIKRTMEDTFGHVRVRGEVGRVSRPSSGHVYLDLKDERAVLACVMWKRTAARQRFMPEQGMEVVATGRITTYAGQSKYQLVIETLEPAGIGALMALLEERKRKLAAEGLFDAARKKPLPWLPRVIGVVTSPTGAVIRDILHRLEDRFPRHVIVWPVRVQGETCAEEVARAIAGFNALPETGGAVPRPDLIIVARGGGSLEDLWGFNEEIVVRAAAASEIPLISAVGHETDWTLIDLAADWRAPTPTAAAEKAVPVRRELMAWTAEMGARLRRAAAQGLERRHQRLLAAARALPRPEDILAHARQRLDLSATRLDSALRAGLQARRLRLTRTASRLRPALLGARTDRSRRRLGELIRRLERSYGHLLQTFRRRADLIANRLARQAPGQHLIQARQRLLNAAERLHPAMERLLARHREALLHRGRLLESLSYRAVLARGFVLVTDEESGRPVTRARQTRPGQLLSLRFHDDVVAAQVRGDRADVPAAAPASASSAARRPAGALKPRRRSRKKNTPPEGQGSLF
jgi:exodeoxyribonuclease VII large subunit